jgi:hypothetical protein
MLSQQFMAGMYVIPKRGQEPDMKRNPTPTRHTFIQRIPHKSMYEGVTSTLILVTHLNQEAGISELTQNPIKLRFGDIYRVPE